MSPARGAPPAHLEPLGAMLGGRTATWLVTGAAGFIGSHLVETLLRLGQRVTGVDNFSTSHARNLDDVRAAVGDDAARRLRFIEGDLRDVALCREACAGADYVLHQAALGSVSRSLEDPLRTHGNNVDVQLGVLLAARDAGVRRVVYASSSSVYGDHPALPKREEAIGRPLSPYAVTKRVNELYGGIFAGAYGLETIGLRYFNVFGPRQDPVGPYAAVIPRWVDNLLSGTPCRINGDGETSRDFCYVANTVQANLRAALVDDPRAVDQIYNVAAGGRTTLNQLFAALRDGLAEITGDPTIAAAQPEYQDFRPGDVRHSQADIEKARTLLGYAPDFSVRDGLAEVLPWYVRTARERTAARADEALAG
jgi:UDP-N-acetylglucosamine/UDP-N-acetylgalactosamine 4-epimerase